MAIPSRAAEGPVFQTCSGLTERPAMRRMKNVASVRSGENDDATVVRPR